MTEKDKRIYSVGEVAFGSEYGEQEITAVIELLRESMVPTVGFRAAKEEREFELGFAELCGTDYAIAFNGAGAALDLILRSLEIQEGDEVVSCSINFAGTHLAIIGSGAKLILSEPDPTTINIDSNDLRQRLTDRTRAIVVTNMNGLAADMDQINRVIDDVYGDREKPKVIVDAARAMGTTHNGRHIGAEAWATFFSFQSKKTLVTLGEGGMVVTNDAGLNALLTQYRSFGKGEGWGSNFKMTKLQAAVGRIQLEKLHRLVGRRRELALARNEAFSHIEGLTIQMDTQYSNSSYYLYTLILSEAMGSMKRDLLRGILAEKYGIGTVIANPPTYQSNKLIESHVRGQDLPIAESIGQRIICLPIHPAMTDEENEYIIESFLKACDEVRRA